MDTFQAICENLRESLAAIRSYSKPTILQDAKAEAASSMGKLSNYFFQVPFSRLHL